MATHVNIGEAKTRLSELVTAAVRGEEVVLDRAGAPQVRLVPVEKEAEAERNARAERRRSALGMFASDFAGLDLSLRALKSDRTDPDERYRLKFADTD